MKNFVLIFLLFLSACAVTNPQQTPNSPPSSNTPAGSTSSVETKSSHAPGVPAVETKVTTYITQFPYRSLDSGKLIETLAFGSCANQDQAQPIWKTIEATSPDLFLFTGDNVYASSPHQRPRAEQYRKLDLIPEFRSFREKVPFLATWDDHDYGIKDGGTSWTEKVQAQKDFMNFWPYMRAAIPLGQEGIYHSKIIGPKNKRVQIIMLDTRYFRSDLTERPELIGKAYNFLPDDKGTVLGEPQWKWLESELRKKADLRFIVSSYQLIPNDPTFEKWGNFPKERQRFFDLLVKTKAKNSIIISGDRHIGTMSKMPLKGLGNLYEVTASALNRPTKFTDADQHYIGNYYNSENFGVAKINWSKKEVQLELKDISGHNVNAVTVPFR